MKGEQRRKSIIEILNDSKEPLSGAALASRFQVSRQIIVSDITLLKAEGYKILSTYRGYILQDADMKSRIFKVRHNDEEIRDELYIIVDAGGKVLDVFVNHEIYGRLKADLLLSSRKDVDIFSEQMKAGRISPLKHLTNDYHYHTVLGDSEEILDFIENQLEKKGYLSK